MRNRSSKFVLAFWILTSIVIFGVNCLHAQSFKLDTNLDYCEDDLYPGSCAQQRAQGGFKNTIGKNATTANENFKQLANNEIDETAFTQAMVGCFTGKAPEKCQFVIDSGIIPPANQCANRNKCVTGFLAYSYVYNFSEAFKYGEEIIKLSPSQLQNDIYLQVDKQMDPISFQEEVYDFLMQMYVAQNDVENAIRIAMKGCNTIQKNKKTLAKVCSIAGRGANQNNEYHKAAQYYKKACDLNVANLGADDKKVVGESCVSLATLYFQGQGVRQNYYKFAELARKGCDLLNANSCVLLGIAYRDGVGVAKSLQQAKKFYGKGCDLGEQVGCDEYKRLNQRGVK